MRQAIFRRMRKDRFKILKALLTKTGVNFWNISAEYGFRNIRLVYGKTNNIQKTSTRAPTIV
ncbi:hypothetical protein HZS_961 [Henneguya salminicola]|nr:hypothetical protein HZS_961 [Henneguya salminicola]